MIRSACYQSLSAFQIQSEPITKFLENENDRPRATECFYEHQIDAVLRTKDYFNNGSDRGIVVLPTGCGKTGVAVLSAYVLAGIYRSYNTRTYRVLVITPSKAITEQIEEALRGQNCFLIKRGCISCDDHLDFIPTCGRIATRSDVKNNLQNHLMILNAHKLANIEEQKIPADIFDLVIIDEAHHYPAQTWKIPVDYFTNCKKLFLTATPFHKGKKIDLPIFYELTKEVAIARGIIRAIKFEEVTTYDSTDDISVYVAMSQKIEQVLDNHDESDPTRTHQAMILVRTTNEADMFNTVYNTVVHIQSGRDNVVCAVYYSGTRECILESFKNEQLRALVVAGKLIEGFDHKNISVVAIARNVQKKSRVLFAQFVGRAVRKAHPEENINAIVISHSKYKQRQNFEQFYEIADEDIEDEEGQEEEMEQ